MKEERIYDITEVCKILGTTSRTLRFYEEKGIISSTTQGISLRRQYTIKQFAQIRNVLVLRALGLSLKTICELQNDQKDLKSAVLSRRAEIYASIESRIREIDLLNDALISLDQGDDIFDISDKKSVGIDINSDTIASICTDAIIYGDTETLFRYFSPRMIEYTPRSVYEKARSDTFLPLGSFVSKDRIECDPKYPHRIYSYVRFSNWGLKITFVLHGGIIEGLWLGYYD